MMKLWMRERDQLIEQTLAFVEGVTAARPRAEPKPEPKAMKPAEAPKSVTVGAFASERAEIERRVACFKANQQKFQREREQHYDTVFSKTRAVPGNTLSS